VTHKTKPGRGFFIAGTDTGVGKVAGALIRTLVQQGRRVAGMKPVAAGADETPDGFRNDDALALRAASNVEAEYSLINPYCFPAAVSPHIAAREAGVAVDIGRIVQAYEQLAQRADVVIVEGAGGWLAPMDDQSTMADIARALNLPVILVVGLRLGCLNHALLTAQAIAADGLELAAWIGSHVDPRFSRPEENIATLKHRLGQPAAAIIPHNPSSADLVIHIEAHSGLG
jgi:dethiobiotin synthetase